jgi:hypothetical protein
MKRSHEAPQDEAAEERLLDESYGCREPQQAPERRVPKDSTALT